MRITITAVLAAGLLGLTSTLFAAGPMPDRGMTQDAVKAKFGAPKRQVAPVGNPPISRWVYDDFTVYFEGKLSIHSVSHAKTLTTPVTTPAPVASPAIPPVRGTVDELPPIEEIGEPAQAPAAVAAEPAPTPENTFRFDPVSGRIIEIGPDGQPIQSPTAQPSGQPALAPTPEPVREDNSSKTVAPVVAPQTAPASAPAGSTMRFDPTSGRMVEVGADGQPIVPAPAAEPAQAPAAEPTPVPTPAAQPAATPEPATPPGKFRFDPATGRIVMDDAAPAAEAAPTPTPEPAAPAAEEPAPLQPAAEPAREDGGFSIQW
jgi:hypothetical protein